MIKWPSSPANRFFEATKIFTFALSKDETKLVFDSNIKGEFDLWGMDLPNTYPYPLTLSGQITLFPIFSPDGSMLAFSADQTGDENYQIYLMQSTGSELVRITEGDGYHNEVCQFDGKGKIYYTSNRADLSYMNIFTYDLDTGDHQLLFQEEANCYSIQIFADQGYVYYIKHFSHSFIQSWLYDLQSGEHLLLTPEDVPHVAEDVQFISKYEVLFTTNLYEKYRYIMKYDFQNNEYTVFLREPGDIGGLKVSSNKKWISYIFQKGVEDYLYLLNLESGRKIKVPTEMTTIYKVEFGQKSGKLYFLGSSAISSENIFTFDLSTGQLLPVTNNPIPGVKKDIFVCPETVRYRSFDGLEIEGLLFKAEKNYNDHWIIWPHGGPQSAIRKSFRGMFQYLLANGFSIFAPNFRGSTHYGADFLKMVEQDWGEGPRLDLLAGVEWLIKDKHINPQNMFIIGESYGGYLALLLHGRHPHLWKGVVNIFGPTNLISFVQSIPEFWRSSMKQRLGDAAEDRKRLIKDSPITYLENMTKPMLIIQGANDPRVIKEESDQFVNKVRKQGVRVEYLILKDEGHGFSRRNNEIEVAERIVRFLYSLM